MTVIIGVKLSDKVCNAVKFQEILTEFNCIIKLRIGINNSSLFCASDGIVLLQVENTDNSLKLEQALLNISGIEIQRMIF